MAAFRCRRISTRSRSAAPRSPTISCTPSPASVYELLRAARLLEFSAAGRRTSNAIAIVQFGARISVHQLYLVGKIFARRRCPWAVRHRWQRRPRNCPLQVAQCRGRWKLSGRRGSMRQQTAFDAASRRLIQRCRTVCPPRPESPISSSSEQAGGQDAHMPDVRIVTQHLLAVGGAVGPSPGNPSSAR